MKNDTLIKRILEVFPVDPPPSKEDVLYAGAYPGESELEEIKQFFGDRPWNAITPANVFNFRFALSFFSPPALAYYTPAWMTCSLIDEVAVDTAIDDLVSTFGRTDPKLWSQAQREVICAWLDHFKESEPEFGKNRFEIVKKAFE
ncbi:MAG TPA: DUF6714 family protein [Candidatus Acidoferrales bacterium]|jgi:hypothetical protein|nr:DUF6714 family protein [Candidatus Acidoferrales bacterium]